MGYVISMGYDIKWGVCERVWVSRSVTVALTQGGRCLGVLPGTVTVTVTADSMIIMSHGARTLPRRRPLSLRWTRPGPAGGSGRGDPRARPQSRWPSGRCPARSTRDSGPGPKIVLVTRIPLAAAASRGVSAPGGD